MVQTKMLKRIYEHLDEHLGLTLDFSYSSSTHQHFTPFNSLFRPAAENTGDAQLSNANPSVISKRLEDSKPTQLKSRSLLLNRRYAYENGLGLLLGINGNSFASRC